MDKWLDPYLGPGATDVIWFSPHSVRPEMLRNAVSSGTAEQCEHNLNRQTCPQCTATRHGEVHE